ncbi:MAG: hypothetical protein M1817_004272 [Caeruleum heppii]|nr:MAG: hypothetical protein M1817_004272 [Caeruleum heppii]
MASSHGLLPHLLPPTVYRRQITDWLAEDCPSFDFGGFVVGDRAGEARLLGKSAGMLAGVPFFDEVFRQLDCTVDWHVAEGTPFEPVKHVATVRGPVRKILLGERVALNTLARCSGIATRSRRLVSLLRDAGYQGTLAGTRKTTPGFRLVEKYGMLVGGCDQHRHDLSHMTMLKDNHVTACGSIPTAIAAARSVGGFATKIEVECRSLDEAFEAAASGADIVMLDNFKGEEARRAATAIKERFTGTGKEVLVEVSGGVDEGNVREMICRDIDIISTSSIHQSASHVDFSLKVVDQATAG